MNATTPNAVRLVSGTLGIDPSGRAWIQGVAQETIDGNADFGSTLGRMGAFSG